MNFSDSDVAAFHANGYVHLSGCLDPVAIDTLRNAVDQLQSEPENPGGNMKYFETGPDNERKLCRVENFLDRDSALNDLITGEAMCTFVSALMGEPAQLFKEKINFKLPGGAGFAPHQDAPAFTTFGHTYHITVMVSFDESTIDNGCLEVVPGAWPASLLPMREDLTLDEATVASLTWTPVPTQPGDVIAFGSYLPHRSGPNASGVSRRALYATYNRQVDGDVRDAYFRAKREAFPPDVERIPGKTYDSSVFNVGNPLN